MKKRLDINELSKIETQSQIEERKMKEAIIADIMKIDKALKSDDVNYVKNVHVSIDGKYQACIDKWGMSMCAFHPEYGFSYMSLDIESLKFNLAVMKPKLEAYMDGWNSKIKAEDSDPISVIVHNNIKLDITFESAKQQIEEMDGLTQGETEEIQRKIDELETISKEPISKKKKWEKMRPILRFALDKSLDVAIMLWNLCIQKVL